MSVYIKGMEMQTDCGHCPLNRLNTEYGGLVYECIITGHYLDDGYEGTIMSNCPLIPVPDHGRLIDADALYENCIPTGWDGKSRSDYVCAITGYQIKQAPTIIPADKEKTDEN